MAAGADARSLEGAVVAITGTDRPLGRGLALALVRAGAAVGLLGRTETGLSATIAAAGGRAVEAPTGLEDRASAEDALGTVVQAFGRLDALVYSAVADEALDPMDLSDVDDERFSAIWERAMWETILCCQAAFSHLTHHAGGRGGRIVLVTPTLSMSGAPRFAPYSAAVEGQRLLAKSAARQWGRDGITVNCLAPAAEHLLGPEWRTDSLSLALASLGSPGDPVEDLGPALVWLLSDAAHFVTGATLCADGGVWMSP
jgi:NAD(P)-dependent dehydrogenase (short-subunit alcohol dehydrogenase family)